MQVLGHEYQPMVYIVWRGVYRVGIGFGRFRSYQYVWMRGVCLVGRGRGIGLEAGTEIEVFGIACF